MNNFEAKNDGVQPISSSTSPVEDLEEYMVGIDTLFAQKVVQELKTHNLEPDGATFYICDTGIGHGIRIAKQLQEMGVSSGLLIDQSTMSDQAKNRLEQSIRKYGKPESVDNVKGAMVILDGHASYYKSAQPVIDLLPDAISLKTNGVKKVVLLAEAKFEGKLESKDGFYFKHDLPVIRYLNKISETDSGIEVFAVGVEVR